MTLVRYADRADLRARRFEELAKPAFPAYMNENEPGNKTGRYFQKTSDGKRLLRTLMTRYIPDAITRAEKQGFSSPDASWFKGQSIDLVRNRLLDPKAAIYEVLDHAEVSTLVEEHLSGAQNRRLLIWSLLNVDQWMRQTFS